MPGTPSELRWGWPLNRKRADDRGEALALEHLLGKGYSLVERNYRTRYGEIDLILRAAETLMLVLGCKAIT
ncbi:MAG: YraN family protein [Actinomycetota bacterium]|nr:YraN family protein [Actinomycetota bacterium]